jgi:hypothetical protein
VEQSGQSSCRWRASIPSSGIRHQIRPKNSAETLFGYEKGKQPKRLDIRRPLTPATPAHQHATTGCRTTCLSRFPRIPERIKCQCGHDSPPAAIGKVPPLANVRSIANPPPNWYIKTNQLAAEVVQPGAAPRDLTLQGLVPFATPLPTTAPKTAPRCSHSSTPGYPAPLPHWHAGPGSPRGTS